MADGEDAAPMAEMEKPTASFVVRVKVLANFLFLPPKRSLALPISFAAFDACVLLWTLTQELYILNKFI